MKRQAILIGRTGAANPLAGVNVDLAAYEAFLKSPIGGAWNDEEIKPLLDKGSFVIYKALDDVPEDTFCLVVYAGHAHTNDAGQLVLDIPGGPIYTNENLRTKAALQLTILDCCRDSLRILPPSFPMKLVESAAALDPGACRNEFEHQLVLAKRGHVEILSCSANEKSIEFKQVGGLYSKTLLDEATAWASTTSRGASSTFLSIGMAHSRAAPVVVQSSGRKQHPVVSSKPMNLEMTIPFAVLA